MTVPLGNTPTGGADTPDELKKDGLLWMGNAVKRNEAPVLVFYRTIDFPPQFAPKPNNIDPNTGRPRLVDPVTVDLYFPNGPLAGRVYRRVGFIGSGWTRPIRATAIGSINVGQLAVGTGANGEYPQLNGLDQDALAWASKVHQEAGGDVFAHYSGQASAPVTAPAATVAQATQPPADRFAGMPTPAAGSAQPAAQGPPAGMPGAGGPPPGFAAPAAQGMPAGMQPTTAGIPAAPAAFAQPAPQGPPPGMGQPGPVGGPPPSGVPALDQQGPPPGMPAWAQGQA